MHTINLTQLLKFLKSTLLLYDNFIGTEPCNSYRTQYLLVYDLCLRIHCPIYFNLVYKILITVATYFLCGRCGTSEK